MDPSSLHTHLNVLSVIRAIESTIATYYGHPLLHRAEDFLCAENLNHDQRACLFISQTSDNLDLSIYFHKEILESIIVQNPLDHLNIDNLDAFCVLIEEISHFHMVIHHHEQGVSWIGLELQAEIDKLLVCSLTLFKQHENYHIEALTHVLFDLAYICENQPYVYQEANRRAAYFWYRAIANGLGTNYNLFDHKFRQLMVRNYRSPDWQQSSYIRQPIAL